MAAGYLLILLCWLLPAYLTLRIVLDGAEPESVRSDPRILPALALNWAAAWVIWFRPAGPFGPVSQALGLIRRTVTYQTFTIWPVSAALCLLAGVGIGILLRGVRVRRGKLSLRRVRTSQRCRKHVLLVTSASALLLALCFWIGADGASRLSLQEVCRKERTAGGDHSYVLIKNEGVLPNSLSGVSLSTGDEETPWRVPEGVRIAPGDTLRVEEEQALFLSIRADGGDTLELIDAYGNALDSVLLPALGANVAYRRSADGWSTVLLNETAGSETVAAPQFSAQGGFYDEPFALTLSAPDGSEIYYTLDGGVPDEGDVRYSGAIRVYDRSSEPNRFRSIRNVQERYLEKEAPGETPVDKAFVVRAVAVDADGNRSATVTQTYFVGQSAYAEGTVLSLVADPDALFGPDGIYVTGEAYEAWYARYQEAEAAGRAFEEEAPTPNFRLRGPDTERPADLELFEDGVMTLSQPVGIRVQGNSSRSAALKRFTVHSRAAYGTGGLFETELFPGKKTHAFVLRDGLDNNICHAAAEGRDVAVLRARPVTVFLNGEFWYRLYLTERYNGNYFAQTYGVCKDNVELISIGAWKETPEDEKAVYEAMIDAAAGQDLSDPDAYAAFCEIVDIQSYIDYACINVYLGNADSHEHLNTCVWRTKIDEFSPYGDGRWRWALNDMDLRRKANRIDGVTTDAEINSFTAARNPDWPPLLSGGRLYESLKQSPAFRRQFVLTFMDLVNTTFSPARMEQILARFGETLDGYDHGFFRDRAGAITRYLAEEFGLAGTQAPLTLRAEGADGQVTLNTITPDLSSGSWTGSYFTDYPVTLTATPAAGHTFDHWEVDGAAVEGDTVEVTLQEGGTTVNAIFR